MTKLDKPSSGPECLRELFEKKELPKQSGSEKEKLDYIFSKLDKNHLEKVNEHNKGLVRKFGSVLLLVNYNDSQLIDRLGGGSLGAVDIQDGAIAFIMGYSESVQGHGIRYLCEYGIYKDGKVISTGPMTYRGAYASEQDHWERAYNEIKILETKGDVVTFGVKSNQQLLLQEWKTDRSNFDTIIRYDLAEEARIREKQQLIETLTTNRKDNLENIKKLISNKSGSREDVKNPFVTEKYAIFPVVKYDQDYDATDISYKLYIVGDKFPEPTMFHQASFLCKGGYSTRRFFRDRASLSFKEKDQDSVDLHIDYDGYYQVRDEDKVITLPTAK